eukprot:UN25471
MVTLTNALRYVFVDYEEGPEKSKHGSSSLENNVHQETHGISKTGFCHLRSRVCWESICSWEHSLSTVGCSSKRKSGSKGRSARKDGSHDRYANEHLTVHQFI